jgi:glucan phosphorylase
MKLMNGAITIGTLDGANILNCGKFSTDRTIGEYNRDIWKLTPQPVTHK